MRGNIEIEVIDSTKQIADLVDWLTLVHSERRYEPALYIDLEGVNLCREGSVSIFSLAIDIGVPKFFVKLIDVSTLGHLAFNTTGVKCKSLKKILEDREIPKVFFDVRNDSDALFTHYGVAIQGVEDVQLMESATRTTTASRRFLSGLNKCVGESYLEDIDRSKWTLAKNEGE